MSDQPRTYERLCFPEPMYLCPIKPGWPTRRVDQVEWEEEQRRKVIRAWFDRMMTEKSA